MSIQRPKHSPGDRPKAGRSAGLRRASIASCGAALALAILVAAQPVMAENCIPTVAAFPPGQWVATGITTSLEDADGVSALIGSETVEFAVLVEDTGVAIGDLAANGEGALEMMGSDEGYAAASWNKLGSITGTASVLQVDGEIDLYIDGGIDTSPSHDDDPITGGDDVFGFDNHVRQPFTFQFSPSGASCNQVVGSLGGPLAYGSGQESVFWAFRIGARASGVDVQDQLAGLIEAAQSILNMDPVDTDVLAQFVHDMLAFEALLTSLESCDPGNELDMGGAWGMLQSVMFNAMHHYLGAAANGAYAPRDILTAAGIWIQGGSLGWRDGDCISPTGATDGALDLFAKLEDVLLERYPNSSDRDAELIEIAAYQYGMPRLIAAVEGN